jgi:hypothetical protein
MLGGGARLGVIGVVLAVALSGCGKSGQGLSYEQRVHNLEAALTGCDKLPEGDKYRHCLRQTEAVIRNGVDHLCPHAGGYTFEGVHEPCPTNYKPSK